MRDNYFSVRERKDKFPSTSVNIDLLAGFNSVKKVLFVLLTDTGQFKFLTLICLCNNLNEYA